MRHDKHKDPVEHQLTWYFQDTIVVNWTVKHCSLYHIEKDDKSYKKLNVTELIRDQMSFVLISLVWWPSVCSSLIVLTFSIVKCF